MKKLATALIALAAFGAVSTAEARTRSSAYDQARASSAVMFLTSAYPDWAKAALGLGGEAGSAEAP